MEEEPSGLAANLAQWYVNSGQRRPEVFGERHVVEADYRDVLGATQSVAAQSANEAKRNEIIARYEGGGTFSATLQQTFCRGAPGVNGERFSVDRVVQDADVERRRLERFRSGQCSGEVGWTCDVHDVAVAQLNEMC